MKMGTEFWAAHVAAASLEALPASAYARRHGISLSALYYWQRKLKKSGASVQAGKFIALRLAATGPHQNNCTLKLPSGLRLEMSAPPSPDWLAALDHAARGVR
jgi:transposase-like protein